MTKELKELHLFLCNFYENLNENKFKELDKNYNKYKKDDYKFSKYNKEFLYDDLKSCGKMGFTYNYHNYMFSLWYFEFTFLDDYFEVEWGIPEWCEQEDITNLDELKEFLEARNNERNLPIYKNMEVDYLKLFNI